MGIDRANIDSFRKSLEKFRGHVKKEVNRRKQRFATDFLRQLVIKSPFSTGSYISSHVVGINSANSRFSLLPQLGGPGRGAVEKATMDDGRSKIKNSKLFDTIYISNSVPHADSVEYLGWGSIPAYHVYGLTTEYMRMVLKHYMKTDF